MPTSFFQQHQGQQEDQKKRRNKDLIDLIFQIHMRSGESLSIVKKWLPLQGSIKILQYEIFKMMLQIGTG